MRITKEEKEKLRERLLDDALPALRMWGTDGAPVDKIMKRVGLTSGALYSHFKSKEDFFTQVLARGLDGVVARARAKAAQYGPRMLSKFVDYYLNEAHIAGVEKGCTLAALGSEMHRYPTKARALFEARLSELFEIYAATIPQGSHEERLATARFIFSSLVGAVTMARTMKDPKVAKEVLENSRLRLQAFLQKEVST